MEQKIQELIEEAKTHSFAKNCFSTRSGTYGRPTPEMQAWIAECEDFLITNYGKDSAPWRIFGRFNRRKLDKHLEHTFEIEKDIVISSLTACLRISPKKKSLNHISTKELDLSKVFIVHGHDELIKTETARFIENLGLKPIILHEQASSGKTIIEKIEEYSNVGFGIVLYTPCDIGSKKGEEIQLKDRARQNVVFEHGYLIGKIGRKNVCALVKGNIETPNDISGVVYISFENEWRFNLAKELRNSGYAIDMNLVI
ncbi:MAG: nucleotide-binding protein [Kordia sp.]|nr:MAG: nucleotide-binding protein [Kordia sp.]